MDKLDPIVYTADEISALLGMKKSTGYAFIKEVYEKKNAFPVYEICGQYRVPKKAFHLWLEGEFEEEEE